MSKELPVLTTLRPAEGSRKKARVIGRGEGSGRGKTSGRGGKGQTARQGGSVKPGFEGGQMPLARRVPKFGFTSRNRKLYNEIDIELVNDFPEDTISAETLAEYGAIKQVFDGVSVLGDGEIGRAVTLRVQKITAPARAKVEKAGGTVELVDLEGRPLREKTLRKRTRKSIARAERTAAAVKGGASA